MLLSGCADTLPPKNIITISHLPPYIDNQQPSTKKEPYHTICDFPFCHTLSLIASADCSLDGFEHAIKQAGTLHYAKVHMKLLDIVSGSFFDEYIKTGNILMLSEGRAGIDESFSLREGMLRLAVTKPIFERLGLEGKAIPSQGRKHVKARYMIELNLRLPSMVRGKKGFQRVLWAFQHVLSNTKTWLFCNLKAPSDHSGPISAHSPTLREVTPVVQQLSGVSVPTFTLDVETVAEDILELQEWLSLVALESPRIRIDDSINPYLSRYQVPCLNQDGSKDSRNNEASELLQAQWRGLIHSDFVKSLYTQLSNSASTTGWLAISAHAFDNSSYTIIRKKKEVAVCRYMD